MRRAFLNIIGVALCILQAELLCAQAHARKPPSPDPAAPVLKATVDKQKILIGEPIQLMLEATIHGDSPVYWPPLDSLPHFEWVEKNKVDSTIRPGERYYRQYLTVTSFDSGAWAIPRLPFVAGNKKYFTDSIRISIGYTKIDPNKDYHDIKEIIDIPNPFARWFGWIVAAVALLSIALVIWLIRKKRLLKRITAEAAPRLSPYEEAIGQLDELERQQLPANGSVKLYYSRLGDILRLYLYRRMGIASLAETSEELILQLRQLPLPAQQYSELADTLRMSDFVKFAKYQPGLADTELHYRVIRGSVEQLNRIAAEEEEKAEARAATNKPAVTGAPAATVESNDHHQKN
jgi:hypothetical protein